MTDRTGSLSRTGALIAFLAGIWASAAYSLYREALPFVSSQPTAPERVDAAGGVAIPLGLSSYSHEIVLKDCSSALMSPVSRLVMAEGGLGGARSCAAVAAATLALYPTNGFAAFVGAYSDAMLGNLDSSTKLLKLSRELAPNEGWLASLRLRMLRQNLIPYAEGLTAAEYDIRVLGSFVEGRRYLAEWYVEDAKSRTAISSAMSKMSSAAQNSFVSLVKNLTNKE